MTKAAASPILVLAYKSCDTCRRALRWLEEHQVAFKVRPIVDEPPTPAELSRWIPASEVGVRKWLNTSGQSYRALGREKVDAASESDLSAWLAKDGKLVKRPVLIAGERVLVGFRPEQYADFFAQSDVARG